VNAEASASIITQLEISWHIRNKTREAIAHTQLGVAPERTFQQLPTASTQLHRVIHRDVRQA